MVGQTSDCGDCLSRRTIEFSFTIIIFPYDLTNNLKSNVKVFADQISLFSEIWDHLETANVLNNDLRKLCK